MVCLEYNTLKHICQPSPEDDVLDCRDFLASLLDSLLPQAAPLPSLSALLLPHSSQGHNVRHADSVVDRVDVDPIHC